jgi:hypothetical protein
LTLEGGKVDFQEAERRYADLKRQFDAGTIGVDDFNAERQRLMVQDDEGRWWAKNPNNDEWNYYDGSAWVPGTPPDYQEATPEPINSAEQTPSPSHPEGVDNRENGRQTVLPWMPAGLAAMAVVGIALGWTLVSYLRDGPTLDEQAQLEKRLDGVEAAVEEEVRIAQGSNATTTTSTSFVDLPGASVRISVPAREKGLILARFFAESACYNNTNNTTDDYCVVRILAVKDGTTTERFLEPDSDFAFDSTDSGYEGGASWESHATDRSLLLGPGTYTVKVQYRVGDSSVTFRLDDWHLTVEKARAS